MLHKIPTLFAYTMLSILLVFSLVSCERNNDEPSELTRPSSVPSEALWVGGVDGGVYVIVTKEKNNKPEIYNATIYFSNGDVDFKGKLIINNVENPMFNYNDVNSYGGWDGDTLYLQDGRSLSIVDNSK